MLHSLLQKNEKRPICNGLAANVQCLRLNQGGFIVSLPPEVWGLLTDYLAESSGGRGPPACPELSQQQPFRQRPSTPTLTGGLTVISPDAGYSLILFIL